MPLICTKREAGVEVDGVVVDPLPGGGGELVDLLRMEGETLLKEALGSLGTPPSRASPQSLDPGPGRSPPPGQCRESPLPLPHLAAPPHVPPLIGRRRRLCPYKTCASSSSSWRTPLPGERRLCVPVHVYA